MRMNFANRGVVGSFIGLAFLAVIVAMMPLRDGKATPDEHGLPDGIDSSDTKLPVTDNFTEVKFQARAVYAVCSQRPDRNAPGGFGPSDNKPKRVAKPLADSLHLLAEPEVAMPLASERLREGSRFRSFGQPSVHCATGPGRKRRVARHRVHAVKLVRQQLPHRVLAAGAWLAIDGLPLSRPSTSDVAICIN